MELNGTSSPCQGRVEVFLEGLWHTVDSRSWGWSPGRPWFPSMAAPLCRRLGCREALLLAPIPYFRSLPRPRNHITCHGRLGSFSHCNASEASQGEPLSLICVGGFPWPGHALRRLPPQGPQQAAGRGSGGELEGEGEGFWLLFKRMEKAEDLLTPLSPPNLRFPSCKRGWYRHSRET